MKKQTLKKIIITTILLMIHFLLCVLLVYCDTKIYIGILGKCGNQFVIYWWIYLIGIVVSSFYMKITGSFDEPRLKLNLNFKCSRWIKTLLRLSVLIFLGTLLIFSMILFVKLILSNPFLFGNYIPGVYLLSWLILFSVFFKQGYMEERHIIFHGLWALFGDGLCICVFAAIVIGLHPVSYRQAYDIALESGLSAPELQNHGEIGDLSLYFGKWDRDRIDWPVYEKNNMRIGPLDIQKNEEKLGYYFFAGERNGEPWGMAISEKTGRIIKQSAIENPFL